MGGLGEGKSRAVGCECSLAPLCVRASVRACGSLSITHLCRHAIQLLRRRRQQLRQRLAHRRQRYGPLLAGVHTVEQRLELAILDDLPVVPRHLKEEREEREWRVSGESEGMVIGEIGERCTAACTSSSNLLFVKFERILFIELANAPLSNADRTESFCPNSMCASRPAANWFVFSCLASSWPSNA